MVSDSPATGAIDMDSAPCSCVSMYESMSWSVVVDDDMESLRAAKELDCALSVESVLEHVDNALEDGSSDMARFDEEASDDVERARFLEPCWAVGRRFIWEGWGVRTGDAAGEGRLSMKRR